MSRYGSRKFVLTLLAILAATYLVWVGSITPEVYRAIVLGGLAGYGAANVGQKWVEKNGQ